VARALRAETAHTPALAPQGGQVPIATQTRTHARWVNGAACVDLVGAYACNCENGWLGANCEVEAVSCEEFGDANYCDPVNAQCINDGFDLHCECDIGYETVNDGETCTEIAECDATPCANGGDCTEAVGFYTCACAVGFAGSNCGVNIDECASFPCLNDGACVDGDAVYTCGCTAGFEGDKCATDSGECESSPCQNGTSTGY
jgi:Notch-like protein